MKLHFVVLTTVALAAAVAAVNAAAFQDKNKPQQPAGAQGGTPPIAKPGKEHEQIKTRVGTWDVVMTMAGSPSGSGEKGTSVMRMIGDLWEVEDFTGTVMGQPYTGHGQTGYDPDKKKWVGTWIDSMSTHLTVMEGTAEGPNKIVYTYEAPGHAGPGLTKHRLVCECKDNDHVSLSFFETGADGKDNPTMQIEYTRRKS